MSFLLPHFPSSSRDHSEFSMASLSHKKVTALHTLLYEKQHNLFSRCSLQKTIAFTVHDIFQTIIHAYAATFETIVEGTTTKTSIDILKERDITVGFSIKGSTVACLIQEKETCSDIDTTLDFNKIPLPKLGSTSPDDIKAFFSSPAGRVYLKEYYFKVAEEATKALLRLHNEKMKIRNLILAASGIPPMALISDAEIDILKDKFFSNLLLFTGNSTFLLSFGDIDFAIKVPYMNSPSCIHKADSLEIKIPLHPITYHLLSQKSVLSSPCLIQQALTLLTQKKISILEPHKIQFNGFERIMYALTQGWSVLEKDNLYILLQDFYTRSHTVKAQTDILFERLYFLLTKKMVNGGISQIFALRLFLNVYGSLQHFISKPSSEAGILCDILKKAFLTKDYLALFPVYVSQNITLFKDLNAFAFFEKLKLLISPKKTFNGQIILHLEKQTIILGQGLKKEGALLSDLEAISDILNAYQELKFDLLETQLAPLLKVELSPLDAFDGSFKDKIRLLLFKNFCLVDCLPLGLQKDLLDHYKHFLASISQKPQLLLVEGIQEALILFLNAHATDLSFNPVHVEFIKSLCPNTNNISIIPLFCETLAEKQETKIAEALEFSFTRTDSPVLINDFIHFLLNIPEKAIDEDKAFKLIEQTLKVSKTPVSLFLFCHPKINKVLNKETARLVIDRPFWKQIFNELLLICSDNYFLNTYYNVCLHDPEMFEGSFLNLNPDIKFQIFKKILKDQKGDLACIFIIGNGLNPVILNRLIKEELSLFKNKSFKNALLTISESQFNYIIEQLLSLSGPEVGEALILLWEQQELLVKSQFMISMLLYWAQKHCTNKDFFFNLLKIACLLPNNESTALLGLEILKRLTFSQKSTQSLFKSFIDKCHLAYLKLEASSIDTTIKMDILALKKQTASLIPLGYSFPTPWASSCQGLPKEAKSVQEALAEYFKDPQQIHLFSCLQCLQAQQDPLEEVYIHKLKDAFKAHEPYLLHLMKYINRVYSDLLFKERIAKEIFEKITNNDIKISFLELYIDFCFELKHFGFMIQNVDLSPLSRSALTVFLDKLFAIASDDIKTRTLIRLKECFSLSYKPIDLLFEYFKNIKGFAAKKAVLFDYFITSFCQLTPLQQQELFILPLAVDSSETLAALKKAETNIKYLEALNQIINKRSDKECALSVDAFLHMAYPIFDKILSKDINFEPKHYQIALNFIEKVIALYKETKQQLSQAQLDKLLILLDTLPLGDILRDLIFTQQKSLPMAFITAFLNKRKEGKSFNKSDGEKYYKILINLLEEVDPTLVCEYFNFFNAATIFNVNQKTNIVSLILAKAIKHKQIDLLHQVFDSKKNSDEGSCTDVSFLQHSSKPSKKLLYEAIANNLEQASSIASLELEAFIPFKYVSNAYGAEAFSVLKEELKIKALELLAHNLQEAYSLESLDIHFISPFQKFMSYFEPCHENTTLLICFIQKLQKRGVEGLLELHDTIEGFDQVISKIALMTNCRYVEKNIPLFDISLESIRLSITDCLYEKIINTNPSCHLLTLLNRIKLFSPAIAKNILINIGYFHSPIVFEFMNAAKESDLVVLLKTIGRSSSAVYEKMAAILIARVAKGEFLSLSSFIYPILNCNYELCDFLIKSLKSSKIINIQEDVLKLPLDVFSHMMVRYFDFKEDSELCNVLLERKRLLEHMTYYKYFVFFKNLKSGFDQLYLSHISQAVKASFFEELEITRLFESQSIIEYCQYIYSEDAQVAKMYLDYYGSVNPMAILNEIKAVSYQNYYKKLYTIYNVWLLNNLHQELYLPIADDSIAKLEHVLAEIKIKGELDLETLKSLYKALNFLSLSYDHFFGSAPPLMKEKFNAVFLNILIMLLESKQLLKEYDYYATSFFNILTIIKLTQISDILVPAHVALVDQFMKSSLKLFAISQMDYIKKGSLNKNDLEATKLWQNVIRENIFLRLTKYWITEMGVKNIDLFLQFFIMSQLVLSLGACSEAARQDMYKNLFLIAKGYFSKFKQGYRPKKSESVVIDQVLKLFNPELTKSQRESNVMTKLYEIDPEDLESFKFYTCLKIIKEGEKVSEPTEVIV